MVFAREDNAAHPACPERTHDGIGIEPDRVENVGVFVSVAPLLAGERVHGEMQETGEFKLVPMELAFGGDGAVGSWGRGGTRRGDSESRRRGGQEDAARYHLPNYNQVEPEGCRFES